MFLDYIETWRGFGTITAPDLKHERDEIIKIAANHGAENFRIFGSVARDRPLSQVILMF
jgi:hypothetical protein